ncbi:hypothetical protein CRENBAI_006874 [Crenichthys baileyi]|uniref:SH3 domain-containing protein n=1 Tax=Crenichthys baileyi TaxID=28760 RepID=A0AAV9SC89_9TELE
MSRVQAIKNHKGKDCRFLNFRRGDTIFVYHKLTGKREDLWAGSIDKQFGYFPKDAVQEEDVFATMRKVVETQKSDFFCMDESGYPIDTNHLDTDEDDDHNFQEPESIQITPHSHDTNAQDSFMSTESTVKEREDEDGNKDLIYAAKHVEDEPKTSASPEEQGGSPSSSWLRSSVTEWLGLAKEEQSGESEQGKREDEREETKSEASLTSPVTGWLGFGGEGQHENDEDSVKIREDSFTSSLTGWLGFGEEKKTITVENEEIEETGNEKEPTETFRSRRMSLDLEGSKLQEEEKEDMGTLGWLGSGLSSRLGFGSSSQDSGGEGEGVKEQPASSSWMEMRIGGIWGFRDSNTEADGSKGPGSLKEEGAEVTNQVHKLEESTLMSENSPVSGDDNKEKLFNKVTGLSQQEILEEESLEETQVSHDQEGSNERSQVVFSSLETEILQGELGLQQETQPMEASSQDDGSSLSGNTESLYDNVSENDGGKISLNETTPGIKKKPGFPHNKVMQRESDADRFKETVKDQNELTEKEKSYFEEEAWDESKLKLTVGSERETESPEGLKEDVTEMKQEEVKEVKEQIKELKQEGQQRKLEDIHKNEIEKEEEMVNVSRDGRELRKERQKGAEELEEGEKLETALLKKEQAKVIWLKESEEPNEKEQKEEKMGEVSGESLSDKEMELRGEREKDAKKLNEKDKHIEELLEHGNQIRVEELKESEEQNEKEEKADVSWEREEETKLQEEMEKEVEEQKDEENQETELLEHEQATLERLEKSEEPNGKEERADVSGGKEVEMELKEERQNKIEELKEDTELPEHEEARVEGLKKSGEPNKKEQKEEKMGEVSGESLSDKEMELRGEREKDAKKLNEKDKHIEELLEHGNQIRVDELKKSEEENKKEEKAEVSWEREEETELQEEMEKEVEEQKDEENQETELLEHEQATLERLEKSEEPNGKKKGAKVKKTGVFGESNREEGKELREQKKKEEDEPKEKMVKEFVKYENQISVKELKEYEEQNKEEKKENEEQVQEGQLKHNKTDIWRPELDIFEKELLDNSSLASLVPETNTEILQEEEEKEVENQNKNELDKEKEHMMKGLEVNNIDVGGSEDGEWTGKLNDDGNWKEDRDNSDFEEEIRNTDATKTGNEFHRDRREDKTYYSAESQVQISEQTKSTHPPQGTESESKGALGLFKNALGVFSQMPIPVMTESTQSVQNFKTNSPEPSQPCGSFSPELDSSTDSLHAEATHTAFPPEQLQPHPISAKNLNYNAPSVTEAPSKTKTLNKHYTNLYHHMNAGEVVILQDLFGRHKLQFLDYILTSSDAMTAEEDQSILSDIERLLQHHMEMLDAPSMSITDVPQEDKQRTSAIFALQKLGTFLKTVKETVSTGISDVSNHQAGHNSSQTKDEEDNSQPSSLREDDGGNVKDWNYVEEERRDTGSKDRMASLHHTQPGSQQKGLIKQTLEFIHRVAGDSIIYAHAVMEILVWIIVQAQDFGKDFKISIQQ